MSHAIKSQVVRAVEWLKTGVREQQYQAAMLLRIAVTDVKRKVIVREAGAIPPLVAGLDINDSGLVLIMVEALSCLIAGDLESRDDLRKSGGVLKLVTMLKRSDPETQLTHRILLALCILSDKEVDRSAIIDAGGIQQLLKCLNPQLKREEIIEYAARVIGNIAAGSQGMKDAVREAGAIRPLLRLMREFPNEFFSEAAAVAIGNLILNNDDNKRAIIDLAGVDPFLRLLSNGLQDLRQCTYLINAEYVILSSKQGKEGTRVQAGGCCCFDVDRGQLCVLTDQAIKKGSNWVPKCFAGRDLLQNANELRMNAQAHRFSCLGAGVSMIPGEDSFELVFDKQGAERLMSADKAKEKGPSPLRLLSLTMKVRDPHELKALMIRMLQKVQTERAFKLAGHNDRASFTSSIGGQSYVPMSQRPAAFQGIVGGGTMTSTKAF